MTINLYFPGNSILNKNELDEFAAMMKEEKWEILPHSWEHWHDESKTFDAENEYQRLREALKGKDMNSYGILAKSIGTYFASEVIDRMEVKPKYVVLMGIPTGIEADKLAKYYPALKNSNAKIIVIQNDKDPYGSLEEVKSLLKDLDYELIVKNADTHRYSYSDEVKDLVAKFQ